MVLKCDRGGEYVNVLNLTDEMRQRETHTKLTGCDFEIVCSSVKGVVSHTDMAMANSLNV